MKPKWAVIGNSHLACIKKAYDADSEAYPFDLTFFGASGWRVLDLRQDTNGYLYAEDGTTRRQLNEVSGGLDRIDPTDFVGFFFVIGVTLTDILRVVRSHVPYKYRQWRKRQDLISDSCFQEVLQGLRDDRSPRDVYVKLNRDQDKKAVFVHPPFPAEQIRDDRRFPFLKNLDDLSLIRNLKVDLYNVLDEEAAQVGWKIFRQPESTLVDGCFTDRAFSKGGVGIANDIKYTDEEFSHMNDRYGAAVLSEWSREFGEVEKLAEAE